MWLSACSDTALAALWLQSCTGHTSGVTYVELLAVLTGSKAVVRLVLSPKVAQEVAIAAKRVGLFNCTSAYELAELHSNCNGDLFQRWTDSTGDHPRAVYISKSESISKDAANLDLAGDDTALAKLLGYPECCRRAYDPIRLSEWWYTISSTTSSSSDLPFVLNRIALLHSGASYLYDYFPCSFNCRRSVDLAIRNRSMLLDHGCFGLVSEWDQILQGEYLVYPDAVLRRVGNSWEQCFGKHSESGFKPIKIVFASI